jgi:hypothetical protein
MARIFTILRELESPCAKCVPMYLSHHKSNHCQPHCESVDIYYIGNVDEKYIKYMSVNFYMVFILEALVYITF